MFCPMCGAQSDDESAFCSKCGAALPSSSSVPQSAPARRSSTEDANVAHARQGSPSAKATKAESKAARAKAKALRPWYKKKRYYLLAVVLAIIIASAAGSHKPANPGSSSTPTTSPSSGNGPTTTQAAVTPTTAAVSAPQEVVFACTGDAPGVTISYGSDSTNDSAAASPFSATLPLSSSSQYYDLTAQLGGSGSINCSVTVHWNQGGHSYAARKVGSASGGYNIADPQVCSDFSGGWQAC